MLPKANKKYINWEQKGIVKITNKKIKQNKVTYKPIDYRAAKSSNTLGIMISETPYQTSVHFYLIIVYPNMSECVTNMHHSELPFQRMLYCFCYFNSIAQIVLAVWLRIVISF